MTAIVFMDTETTGLAAVDHIWEFAAIRRNDDGSESTYHAFVEHDQVLANQLPEPFRADHDARYNADEALSLPQFVGLLRVVFAGRPHVIGAVPNFDTERLARILADAGHPPLWHYHLRDIENLAAGYLLGRRSARAGVFGVRSHDGSWPEVWDDSNELSHIVGVKPDQFARHTALGDVQWAVALYDAITGRNIDMPTADRMHS